MEYTMELTKENVALLASCGVLIGTILSNAITFLIHRSKQKDDWVKENKRKKIQKGEELYKNLVKWKSSVFGAHVLWVNCIRAGVSGNTLNEQIIQRANDNPEHSNIAEVTSILAGIYFPELTEKIQSAKKRLEPANKIFFMISNDKPVSNKQSAVEQILDSGSEFDVIVDDILNSLSGIISDMLKN